MFVCLPAWAIGNLFPFLAGRNFRQPVSGFIELAAGLVHYQAGFDVETHLAGFSSRQPQTKWLNFLKQFGSIHTRKTIVKNKIK